MMKHNHKNPQTVEKQMHKCDICDLVRYIFDLIENCIKKEKVTIKVAKSVIVDKVI